MERKYETEIVRRIYENQEGVYLEVGPDSDGLDCVELRTVDTKSKEYFGTINILLPKELARHVGQALIDSSNEMEK